MSHCLFVTGTDTGVGKTLVSCAIIAALRAEGIRVGVYKPVETGCSSNDDVLVGADSERLRMAAGAEQDRADIASYLFEMPAAPIVAAQQAGTHIDPKRFVADFERVSSDFDFVVVEGAGGLLVPICDGFTYRDLAHELGLPLLCVVGSRLGCVNHALLTLGAAGRGGLAIDGYILNALSPAGAREVGVEANRDTIARFTPYDDLGVFPFVEPSRRDDLDHLGHLAAEHLDLKRIHRPLPPV